MRLTKVEAYYFTATCPNHYIVCSWILKTKWNFIMGNGNCKITWEIV